MGNKIATCCYCGTRATLIFDEGMHELACRACGAPLHEMKALKVATNRSAQKPKGVRPSKTTARKPSSADAYRQEWRDWPAKKRRKPKRKAFARRVLEELWDVVEDIID